jgi:polysaccharide chain length determinant protein (PEP-CTERM system associated)
MPSTTRAGIDAAVAALLRRRFVALAVLALGGTATLAFVSGLPDLYRSTASVLVERPAPSEGAPDDVESRLQSIRQELLSRTRLLDLVGRFGLYPELRKSASEQAVVEQMRRDVRIEAAASDLVSGRRGTIAFTLAYKGREPQQVADVTNALTSSYIEEDSLRRDRQTTNAARLLQAQLLEVKGRLLRQETAIADFKHRHLGALPQQADTSVAVMERLSGRLQRVMENRDATLERRAALVKDSADPEAPAKDPDRARLMRLRHELAELRTQYSERYPDVVAKSAEVRTLEEVVARKPDLDRSGPQLEQIDSQLRGLRAEEARLRAERGAFERNLEQAPLREQEFHALSRDYATTKDFYDSLLKRYEEAQLAEAREDSARGQRLRVIDPAIATLEPVAPDRVRLAMFGLILAVGLALVAAAGAERLDTSFHTAEELKQHTRVPILARLPLQASPAALRRGRRRAALFAACLLVAMAGVAGLSRVLASQKEGIVALLAPGGRS